MRTRHVWVVELLEKPNIWVPCSACSYNKRDAKELLKLWKTDLPSDRLRLKKYVPDNEVFSGASREGKT